MALAAVCAFAMSFFCFLFKPVETLPIQYGICFPSPDSWGFDPVYSWIVNSFLIGLITILLYLLNKSYNFIRTTEQTLYALFPVMATSSLWLTSELNTSVLLCLANVICLGIIFTGYDSPNATRQMFTLGVVAGAGSMCQYAFLPMAFVYFLWSLFMKVMRIRETLAFIIGILCPYWIVFGIGLRELSDFHYPSITPLFLQEDPLEFLFQIIGIGVAALTGFIAVLMNSMKLYAGNSRVNAMNLCVSALGAASVICILVDYDNIEAYVATLYMASAISVSNICALWNPKMPWTVTAVPAVLFMAIYVCSMVL